jgi:hypothetical protein
LPEYLRLLPGKAAQDGTGSKGSIDDVRGIEKDGQSEIYFRRGSRRWSATACSRMVPDLT